MARNSLPHSSPYTRTLSSSRPDPAPAFSSPILLVHLHPSVNFSRTALVFLPFHMLPSPLSAHTSSHKQPFPCTHTFSVLEERFLPFSLLPSLPPFSPQWPSTPSAQNLPCFVQQGREGGREGGSQEGKEGQQNTLLSLSYTMQERSVFPPHRERARGEVKGRNLPEEEGGREEGAEGGGEREGKEALPYDGVWAGKG